MGNAGVLWIIRLIFRSESGSYDSHMHVDPRRRGAWQRTPALWLSPRMTPRRPLLRLALATPLLIAAAPAQDAAAFIRQAGDRLAAIVGQAQSPPARRRALGAFLDQVVDIPYVARFCLGRYWRRASPAQQARYVSLFRAILVTSVLARVGAYRHPDAKGFHVRILRPVLNGDVTDVTTEVARPGSPAAHVTWVVRMEPAGPRIIDLIAEGTSLRITVRADYASFLAEHGGSIPALLAAMARQAGTP